jgi:hypothetical protein
MIADWLEKNRLTPARLASFNDSLRRVPNHGCRALRDMKGPE